MICVTRLNHSKVVLNDELIEHIEASPDTVISMTTGQKFTVLESPGEIVDRVRAFRRSICVPPGFPEYEAGEVQALQGDLEQLSGGEVRDAR